MSVLFNEILSGGHGAGLFAAVWCGGATQAVRQIGYGTAEFIQLIFVEMNSDRAGTAINDGTFENVSGAFRCNGVTAWAGNRILSGVGNRIHNSPEAKMDNATKLMEKYEEEKKEMLKLSESWSG
ncbi:hypothetical protein ACQUQU_04380 [Thalassolituus sp. LLYu03]|uniref:hypothetical protein n=1 Tax=Thalassolituus sp. LLYu03 TaxID=3421656 RepID=UPI003D2A25A6